MWALNRQLRECVILFGYVTIQKRGGMGAKYMVPKCHRKRRNKNERDRIEIWL